MLIKLDSGDYINTEYVTYIGIAADGKRSASLAGDPPDTYIVLSEPDLGRIVKAMGGEKSEDKSITMKLEHDLANEVIKTVGRGVSRKQRGRTR